MIAVSRCSHALSREAGRGPGRFSDRTAMREASVSWAGPRPPRPPPGHRDGSIEEPLRQGSFRVPDVCAFPGLGLARIVGGVVFMWVLILEIGPREVAAFRGLHCVDDFIAGYFREPVCEELFGSGAIEGEFVGVPDLEGC